MIIKPLGTESKLAKAMRVLTIMTIFLGSGTAATSYATNIVDFNLTNLPTTGPSITGMFSMDFDNNFAVTNASFTVSDGTRTHTYTTVSASGPIVINMGLLMDPTALAINTFNGFTWEPSGGGISWGAKLNGTTFGLTTSGTYTPKQAPPIPEPSTMLLLSTGLLGLAGYRWRTRRAQWQQVD